ncbi:MAG: AAA family ATPase [Actinomycetota bacterium]
MSTDVFPELAAEQARLDASRRARDRMIERFEAVDPESAADEITSEFVEVTVADALDSLRSPGAGEFFGWIQGQSADRTDRADSVERWYIGRRHIEDDDHEPLVVDWRAPIAAPFYRATAIDPLGLDARRRFTLDGDRIAAYLDERLDDPEAGATATGIPDPVLAEIGAERSGAMREIVATIQGEQDEVIRAPIDQTLIVQGGPGTGKTAVGLHRVAYLLFEHRARLARDGVLVVGPNRAFLDYVGNVLPSLGERSVRQVTVDELCIPRVTVTAVDDDETAAWKGSADRLDELERAALAAIGTIDDDIVVPVGARRHVITATEFSGWVETARFGSGPINQRRVRLQAIARRELERRAGDGAWSAAAPLKQAISTCWPTQKAVRLVDRLLPGPSGKRRRWTRQDQLLVDEANSLLDGTPFTYGHVVVDEAQDHSAVALRVIGRRNPDASMTLVGDVAQSTTPAGQERWADVFAHLSPRGSVGQLAELTIGYRVPEPVLTVANRLLPLTGVDSTASQSVRTDGDPPRWVEVASHDVAAAVIRAVAELRGFHALVGVVAPHRLHDAIASALAEAGSVASDHVHDLEADAVPLFGPAEVKGLEFDGVVVVNPHEILVDGPAESGTSDGLEHTPRGARLLYVALTRAVQRLTVVTDAPPPTVLAP